jgi:glycosyltransferase involved in cell wall biosynthesis
MTDGAGVKLRSASLSHEAPMNASILYDGHNVSLKNETGIGTYTRALAATARNLGLKPEILVGGNSSFNKKDPQLSEISFFDALTANHLPQKVRLERLLAKYAGKPFGIRTAEFSRVGAVFDAGPPKFANFEKVHLASSVFEFGVSHFKRYGSCAEVKISNSPSLFHLTHPTPLKMKGCPNIYTIHDIVPLRLPQTTLDNKKHFLQLLRHLCAKADHIVTVSEYSRQDIMRFVGIPEDRITNTYQSVKLPEGLVEKSDDLVSNEIGRTFNIAFREYYVFFGAIEPKKNIARIVDAYATSGSPYPLLIVGPLGWQYDNDIEKINDERFFSYRSEGNRIRPDKRVRRIPYLPLSQLMTLVKGARGVLFPSLYEGFGLPVLEAMMLGTPVITSNVSSLPEISGGAALLVDPTDVDEIANAIRMFDHDNDMRDEFAKRGRVRAAYFSLEAYEGRIAGLYAKLGVDVTARANLSPARL